jgi:hypothetical protein
MCNRLSGVEGNRYIYFAFGDKELEERKNRPSVVFRLGELGGNNRGEEAELRRTQRRKTPHQKSPVMPLSCTRGLLHGSITGGVHRWVSDRVNHYLNYIGLASSRRTAHRSLEVLGVHAEKVIKKKMSQSEAQIMPPFLCIDNLDFEQRVHAKSLGHTSKMFHGTWGYIHHLNPKLVSSVPAGDLSLESYTASMKNAAKINVTPTMFLASKAEEQHWTSVLKCQIAKVILEYIAVPSDKDFTITSSPPVVEQISHNRPDITMLKLMVASDNSAQGVEDVCTGIIQQTNLSETQFYNRLLMLDGDLGTCVNVKCLQNQRFPSSHVENSLDNICTLLGGAHTLWNIGHAIYTKHFGNSSDSRDSGAWRYLESLGIPSRKTLDKKDFTLMIDNMIKIHEATLVHCIM